MKFIFFILLLFSTYSFAQKKYWMSDINFNDTVKNEIINDSTVIRDSLKYFRGCFDPTVSIDLFKKIDSCYNRWFLSTFSNSKKHIKEVKFDTTVIAGYNWIRTIPDNPNRRFIVLGDSVYFFKNAPLNFSLIIKNHRFYIDYLNAVNRLQEKYLPTNAQYYNELGLFRYAALNTFIYKEGEGEDLSAAYQLQYKIASETAQLVHHRHPYDEGGASSDWQPSTEDRNTEQSLRLDEVEKADKELQKAEKEFRDSPTTENKTRVEQAKSVSREKFYNYMSGALPGQDVPSAMGHEY